MDKTNDNIIKKAQTAITKSKDSIVNVIDANGNGEIDIEDFIIIGLKTPGIKVDRNDFLKKELFKNYPQDTIDDAIAYNPAHAKIPSNEIDRIADEVIKYERNCVSGISAALGVPGGFAMAATVPADIAQYYGYMLRAAQKLMYLYGFPQIDLFLCHTAISQNIQQKFLRYPTFLSSCISTQKVICTDIIFSNPLKSCFFV